MINCLTAYVEIPAELLGLVNQPHQAFGLLLCSDIVVADALIFHVGENVFHAFLGLCLAYPGSHSVDNTHADNPHRKQGEKQSPEFLRVGQLFLFPLHVTSSSKVPRIQPVTL